MTGITPTDPRLPRGDIAGPGGPHDHGQVVVDTTNAVLLDYNEVVLVDQIRNGQSQGEALGLLLAGRINKTQDHARILFLMDEDGASAIVANLVGLATRAGFGPNFVADLLRKLEEQP
jgi:hypothetical protein